MRTMIKIIFITSILVLFAACGSTTSSSQTVTSGNQPLGDVDFGTTQNKIPTLVVIMNWTDYSENDPSVWHNKIFNKEENSVNRWYYDSTDAEIEFIPVSESSGTVNDGVIVVNMNKAHPGGANDTSFRDVEITAAITSSVVVNSIDFAALDTNSDGDISYKELQIIFIVAGGEESYGDPGYKSIWAHAWSYESNNAPNVDGVNLMRYTGIDATSGSYAKFGATHDIDSANSHKATIGIIAHELGHALFNLVDLYDNGGGSGLGSYGIMSSGSWARKVVDTYPGETPTQFSAYSKIDAKIDANVTTLNSSTNVTIKCSSNELIELVTTKSNEYFLLECRDSARVDSDRAFNQLDRSFTDNRLFGIIYHIDTDKTDNYEHGSQTSTNHYKVAVVERDTSNSLTLNDDVEANFSDTYTQGYVIDTSKTKLYDGSLSGYNIEINSEDYTNRTMTFSITK